MCSRKELEDQEETNYNKAVLLSMKDYYDPRNGNLKSSHEQNSDLYTNLSEEEQVKQALFISAIESAKDEPKSINDTALQHEMITPPKLSSSTAVRQNNVTASLTPGQRNVASTSSYTFPTEPVSASLSKLPSVGYPDDFLAWKNKTAGERSSELFGKTSVRNDPEDVSLAQHQVARRARVQDVSARTDQQRPGSTFSTFHQDRNLPPPNQSNRGADRRSAELPEDEQLRLALELSKCDTRMDFESKTKIAIEQSSRSRHGSQSSDNNERANLWTQDLSSELNQLEISRRNVNRLPANNINISTERSYGNVNQQSTYEPEETPIKPGSKRLIVIDGNNVAYAHSGHTRFSLDGINICVEYFVKRGHEVKVFLPKGAYNHASEEDKERMDIMEKVTKNLVYSPPGSYDDLFSIKLAARRKGIVVSNDRFLDVKAKNIPEYTEQVEKRRLKFTWVDNLFMVPDDPLGRGGPDLQQFLRH